MTLQAAFNAPTPDEVEDFARAAARGDLAAITQFIEKHESAVDAKDRICWTALIRAAACGHGDVVAALLEKGADINMRDSSDLDWTPLMHAAYQGQKDVVKLLIESGAALDLKDEFSKTVRMIARDTDLPKGKENKDAIIDLLEQGGEIQKQLWLDRTDCSKGLTHAIPARRPLVAQRSMKP